MRNNYTETRYSKTIASSPLLATLHNQTVWRLGLSIKRNYLNHLKWWPQAKPVGCIILLLCWLNFPFHLVTYASTSLPFPKFPRLDKYHSDHFFLYICAALCWVQPVMSDSLQPMDWSSPGSSAHGDSPGKNTGVGGHFLLQGIFLTQGSNPGLSLLYINMMSNIKPRTSRSIN